MDKMDGALVGIELHLSFAVDEFMEAVGQDSKTDLRLVGVRLGFVNFIFWDVSSCVKICKLGNKRVVINDTDGGVLQSFADLTRQNPMKIIRNHKKVKQKTSET